MYSTSQLHMLLKLTTHRHNIPLTAISSFTYKNALLQEQNATNVLTRRLTRQ